MKGTDDLSPIQSSRGWGRVLRRHSGGMTFLSREVMLCLIVFLM